MSVTLSFYEAQLIKLQANEYYQKIKTLPPAKQWGVICSTLLIVLVLFFALLYLIFDKIVVIGFLASILAGLATGIGALPALFFKNISDKLFNSLLGAAAGVMLAATVFSLLVPGIDYGNQIWPGNGLWIVSLGMLMGAIFLHFSDQHLPHLHFDSIPRRLSENRKPTTENPILASFPDHFR